MEMCLKESGVSEKKYGLVLWMRRGKRDNLGIIFHTTPLKHML